MGVVDYPVNQVPAWALPELSGTELEDLNWNTFGNPEVRRYYHEQRSEYEETMRVPTRAAYLLRKSIHNHKTQLPEELETVYEMKLLSSVDSFMAGYYG